MEKIGIDLVGGHGISETSTVIASVEAWEKAIEVLNQEANKLVKPAEGGSGMVSHHKKELANELKTLARMFAIKTGLKD